MSNTIELAKSFVPKLDECYRLASLTSVLDGAPELAKQGANANELIIPMMSMDGLADYSAVRCRRCAGRLQGAQADRRETLRKSLGVKEVLSMKQFLDALTALLKVKTIVTLVIIVVLAVLSLNGSVEPDKFLTIATMVVAFYFGTQNEKKS